MSKRIINTIIKLKNELYERDSKEYRIITEFLNKVINIDGIYEMTEA